ncbi:MAG TPA: lysylphosphatidylglycerol synthase domain-containing protein [Gammaproteobacteria bacterium]|nr:lysylphosphatidylglycerol synthase domain-containing protein [Gammaproteobacteria bacterium]
MRGRAGRLLQLVRQPKVAVPLLLAGGLLAAAVSLSDVPQVLARIARIPVPYLLWTLGLAAAYLALKGLQFRGFLNELRIRARWRHVLLAYAVGELTLTLPLGIYAQNYLLQRLQGSGLYRSAAVTTLMLVFEAGLLFLVLAITGVHGWPWLRPLALACFSGLVAVVLLLTRWRGLRRGAARVTRALKLPARAPVEFLQALAMLADLRILGRRGWLTVLYIAALVLAFHTISHGVGVERLGYVQAAGVYAFSLSIALVFGGVTSQVGVVEIAGMGAAQAWGYSFTEGLAMLLGFRLVWTACIWLLCLPVLFWLRRDLVRASASADQLQEPAD